jgi:hypothetical protein
VAGACISPCTAGLTDCGGGVCANLASDNAHCGACATACPAGQVCAAGACGAPAPANDACAAATALTLTAGTLTVTGTTDGAHNDSGCGTGGDVYYSFTLTRREVVYADTFGSGFDTRLAIASTCAVSTNCVDDACGVLQSQLAVVLDAGTYYVVVSGFSGTGAFTLHVQHLPAGNGPVNAISSGASSTASGSTSGTGTVNGSCNSGSAPENTYYWTTCPASAGGTATATFCTSGGTASYDTVLYIQHGDGAAAACNDDSCSLQSSVTSSLNPGAALHAIYVDGYSSSAGSYTLAYTTP